MITVFNPGGYDATDLLGSLSNLHRSAIARHPLLLARPHPAEEALLIVSKVCQLCCCYLSKMSMGLSQLRAVDACMDAQSRNTPRNVRVE